MIWKNKGFQASHFMDISSWGKAIIVSHDVSKIKISK